MDNTVYTYEKDADFKTDKKVNLLNAVIEECPNINQFKDVKYNFNGSFGCIAFVGDYVIKAPNGNTPTELKQFEREIEYLKVISETDTPTPKLLYSGEKNYFYIMTKVGDMDFRMHPRHRVLSEKENDAIGEKICEFAKTITAEFNKDKNKNIYIYEDFKEPINISKHFNLLEKAEYTDTIKTFLDIYESPYNLIKENTNMVFSGDMHGYNVRTILDNPTNISLIDFALIRRNNTPETGLSLTDGINRSFTKALYKDSLIPHPEKIKNIGDTLRLLQIHLALNDCPTLRNINLKEDADKILNSGLIDKSPQFALGGL